MKTIKYILYALTATFVLASCSDDIKYTPGEGEDTDCYGVYFPSQENAGDQELDPAEPTTLTFTAMRKNYNDAITVPVEVSSTENVVASCPASNLISETVKRPSWVLLTSTGTVIASL